MAAKTRGMFTAGRLNHAAGQHIKPGGHWGLYSMHAHSHNDIKRVWKQFQRLRPSHSLRADEGRRFVALSMGQ